MEQHGGFFYFADYAANQYLFVCQLLVPVAALLLGLREYTGKGLRYSKFAADRKLFGEIPSKLAMFLYYAPAMALAAVLLSYETLGFPDLHTASEKVGLHGLASLLNQKQQQQPSLRFLVLASAVFIHFFKRVLEVLLVHRYSGNAELLSSLVIVFFYTFATANLLYAQLVSESLSPPKLNTLWIGLVVFLIGITGNFYHHYLLAQLRAEKQAKGKKNQKRYVVPHGGLFELVACPHYLFEIVTFIGIAMISQTVMSFAIVFLVEVYLTSRSITTRQWYLKKIDGFPKSRKALIPYLL